MIVVVGAGISGVACARALADAGQQVRVLDRGQRLGGRLALRMVSTPTGAAPGGQPHVVDIGGSYLTASDGQFTALVQDWADRGLARPWTDMFAVSDGTGLQRHSTGPMRYGSAAGLRSLVEDLARGLDVTHPVHVTRLTRRAGGGWTVEVEGAGDIAADAVVVAAPDPQAARIMPEELVQAMYPGGPWQWKAVIAVAAAWQDRWWDHLDTVEDGADVPFHGAFVNGDPTLTWLADDGRRRGDGSPVLVAHTTPTAAAGWLADPALALAPVLDAIGRVAGRRPPEPAWTHVQRWGLSQPDRERPAPPYFLHPAGLGVCGDAWGERSSVEGAWLSGTAVGRELAERLA